ncbi:hypothetical protein EYY60_03705 [Flavobacterium zhairuonense]|uniref:HEPN domain-containing protein n=1 Tax=Flavobacterium zhairuonense TaxID=2493631 RepID=UPI0010508347|nr:HEPN domain-containing protein [Flavobacterium zhairuonense]KAF2514371.1 hypothetical protein EYY60_03705 [Flavobacterium zhairuonense]
MIKTKSFATIFHIQVEKKLDQLLIKDNFNLRILSDNKIVKNILDIRDVRKIIGLNEAQALEESNCIFYKEEDYDTTPENFNDRACLIGTLLLIEMFYHALWLIKDNSVHCELAHLFYEEEKRYAIHSNFWSSSYTNSLGIVETTSFSNEEIDEAIKLYPLILITNQHENPLSNNSIRITSKTSRLSRAFFFIQSARSTIDIGTKISIYCSVLESIFSVSTSELKHRLSETIAFFLEKDYENKKRVYKILQNAYDVRSSVVHGDGIQSKFLKNDGELLLQTALNTDEIIRRCMRKIIEDSNLYDLFTVKTRDEVSEYLQNLIFN